MHIKWTISTFNFLQLSDSSHLSAVFKIACADLMADLVTSLVAQLVKNPPAKLGWEGDSGLGTRIHPWRIHVDVWQNQHSIVKQNKLKKKKESAYNAGNQGLIPGSGRSPGEGNRNLLQFSCLEDPMDRGAWWVTGHGVTKSRTRLSN